MLEHIGPGPRSGVVGQTPGSAAALATAVDTDLHASASASGGTAMVEEHLSGADVSVLGFDGSGNRRVVNDIRTWLGQSIHFVPSPGFPIGSAGYSSTSSGPAPSSYYQVTQPLLPVLGGSTITLVGKFRGFDLPGISGSVVVDPDNLAIPVQVLGVLDSTSSVPRPMPHQPLSLPWRDTEGLVVRTPSVPVSGLNAVRITFADGLVANDTWNFGNVPATTTLHLATGTSATYTTALVPFNYFGTNFTTFSVSSDGRICLGVAACAGGIAPTLTNLFTPSSTGPVTTIAALWTQTVAPPRGVIDVFISEDGVSGIMDVAWSDCRWATSGSPVGPFGIQMANNTCPYLLFDVSSVLAEVGGSTPAVIGFSDQLIGPFTSSLAYAYTFAPGESIAQALNSSMPLSISLYSTGIYVTDLAPFGSPGLWILS